MSPDRALIYSILTGGIKAFNEAKRRGIKAEDLFGSDVQIFELFEEFIPKGRLPSLKEIELATKVILPPDESVLDTAFCAEAIYKRKLSTTLNDGIGKIADLTVSDPITARESIQQLLHSTIRTHGKIRHSNSPDTIDEIQNRYLAAEAKPEGLLGLPSPWPSLDKSSLGLQKGELHVLFAKRKVGKCVEANTLCHDPVTGHEQTIEQLVKRRSGSVHSWMPNKPISIVNPSAYIDSGTKDCLRVVLKSGRELIVTPEHPFMTPSGWCPAGELEVGNHVATVGKSPEPSKPQEMSEAEIIILANMIAEGGCTSTTPHFTNYDESIQKHMNSALNTIDCELNPIKGCKGSFTVRIKGSRTKSSSAITLLKTHKIMWKKSVVKTIPKAIFGLSNKQLAVFIGNYWACDGTIEARGIVSASTGSKKLAYQLQHLLLRFGVQTRVRKIWRKVKHNSRMKRYYEVVVRKETIEQFKANFKLPGQKQAKLDRLQFSGLSRVGWLKKEEVEHIVNEELAAKPELLQNIGKQLGYSFVFQKGHIFDTKSMRVRKKIFSVFCNVYNSSLSWTLDPNIWWDEIKSIYPVGPKRIYDVTVESTHCFIANDTIVHNTNCALAWFEHIWRTLGPGENLLIVSMEMPPWQINQRIFATRNKLDYALFRAGKLPPPDKERFLKWCEEMKKENNNQPQLVVVGSDVVRETSDILGLAAQYNPKAILVDGFYILGKGSKKQKWERVTENAESLKLDIAVGADVPVLATTQLSGIVGKQDLDADTDAAAFAKGIGDYADASYGLFMDDMMMAQEKRILRVMDARDFIPIGMEINFSLKKQNFSEIAVIKGKENSNNIAILDNLPDFKEGDAIQFD